MDFHLSYVYRTGRKVQNETEDSFPDHSFYIEAEKIKTFNVSGVLRHIPSLDTTTKTTKPSEPEITVRKELEPYQQYLEGVEAEG